MGDFLDYLVKLTAAYPGLAPWTLLFVFIAGMAGLGGKYALKNVKTLLEYAEGLNSRLQKQLHDADATIALKNAYIRELEDDRNVTINFVQGYRREMAELENKLHDAELTNRSLTHELSNALTQLEECRNNHRRLPHGPE